jgi:uncharacterized membrane protein SirB2
MSYMALKHIHLVTVAITFLMFSLRGIWMLANSPYLQKKWVRIVPHVNDTILLASALALTWTVWWPTGASLPDWIAVKLLGLIAYILLGTVALKRGKTKSIRVAALIAAFAVFFFIVRVALTKQPWPFG